MNQFDQGKGGEGVRGEGEEGGSKRKAAGFDFAFFFFLFFWMFWQEGDDARDL